MLSRLASTVSRRSAASVAVRSVTTHAQLPEDHKVRDSTVHAIKNLGGILQAEMMIDPKIYDHSL